MNCPHCSTTIDKNLRCAVCESVPFTPEQRQRVIDVCNASFQKDLKNMQENPTGGTPSFSDLPPGSLDFLNKENK